MSSHGQSSGHTLLQDAAHIASLVEGVQTQLQDLAQTSPALDAQSIATIVAAVQSAMGRDAGKRPKPKLPELQLFSGIRSEYPHWALAARMKLLLDGASIGEDGDQLAYLYARMVPKAQAQVFLRFKTITTSTDPKKPASPKTFLAYLDSIFVDKNLVGRAKSKLFTLKQRANESFPEFLVRFEKLIAEAQILDEGTQIDYLWNGLNDRLRDRLIVLELPSDYAEYVSTIARVASRIEEASHRARNTPAASGPHTGHSPQQPASDPGAMDWEPSATVNVRSLVRLTDTERDRLRAIGACFRCRQSGHTSRSCPLNNQRGPIRAAAARMPTAAASPTAAATPAPVPAQLEQGKDEL